MPSKGLGWAYTMLSLEIVEILAFVEIVFSDHGEASAVPPSPFVLVYFVLLIASSLLQVAGIALARAGRYRAGGILQIAGSLLHAPKGEGLIGIRGGLDAIRYGRSLAPAPAGPVVPGAPAAA